MPDATVVEPPAAAMGPPGTLKNTQRVALSSLDVAAAAGIQLPHEVPPPNVSFGGASTVPPTHALPNTVFRDTVVPQPAKHLDGVLGEAWGLCDGRRGLLAAGTLILLSATVASIGLVVTVVAMAPLWGGFVVVGLRAGCGRPVIFDDFFAGVRCFAPLAILGAMTGALVGLGTLALVVPGLYAATVSLYAPFLLLDRAMSPLEAFRLSHRTVHERLIEHVGLVVVLALVNLGGLLPLGLGLFITVPFTFVALGVAYGRFLGYAGGVDRLTA